MRATEEACAQVMKDVRLNPASIIPHLENLKSLFLADTPVLALTATRRLRVPEGKAAVEIAIDYLRSRSAESALEYSFGMSEAARDKFHGTAPLTERLKSRGQWTGTCSDFVQLGVEDLDAHTIVSLMIISAGDEKRQIRERIFSADKNVVGIAIGPYKGSTAVAVTLATKFVQNGPTDDLERETRGAGAVADAAPAAAVPDTVAEDTMAALHEANRPQQEDDDATDAELEQQRLAHLARLEQHNSAPNASISTGADDDDMAAIQRDRLAALAALERGQQQQNANHFLEEEDEDDAASTPAHLQAYDPSIETYEEAEARKRAFLEEQERAKAEAIRKAEEAQKNKWKQERAAREAQRKKDEEERLRKLQQGPSYGFSGFGAPRPAQSYGASRSAASAPVNRQPEVVRQARPADTTAEDEEMDALQRERMAKIAALEGSNPYARGASTSGMEDEENVVGEGGGPAAYDPTKESYEEAEARKRAWFAEQERQKQETIRAAEEASKNKWKQERAAREAAKKKEEEERLARLRAQDEQPRKLGGGGYHASSYSRVNNPRGAAAPASSAPPPTNVVRPSQEPVATAHTTPYYGEGGTGGQEIEPDHYDAEEERIMRSLGKKGIQFGREDPAKKREEEMAKRKAEAEARAAQVRKLKEEKWRKETEEAERRAAQRVAEAEAKARALAEGTLQPEMVSPRPSGEPRAPPAAAKSEPAAIPAAAEPAPVEEPAPEPAAAAEEPAPTGPTASLEECIAALQECSEEHPVKLYLNTLFSDQDSLTIQALSEVRDDVSFFTASGHKVSRQGKYAVTVHAPAGDETIRIPPAQLLADDFNSLSDYFFFGTAEHLTLYPSAEVNEAEVLHVSDLTTLSPGVFYYLASGNYVEIIGGENPQFLINGGEKEVALPEEIVEQLRY